MWQAFYLHKCVFESFDQSISFNKKEHLCVGCIRPFAEHKLISFIFMEVRTAFFFLINMFFNWLVHEQHSREQHTVLRMLVFFRCGKLDLKCHF